MYIRKKNHIYAFMFVSSLRGFTMNLKWDFEIEFIFSRHGGGFSILRLNVFNFHRKIEIDSPHQRDVYVVDGYVMLHVANSLHLSSHCIMQTRICLSPRHTRNDDNARNMQWKGNNSLSFIPHHTVLDLISNCRQTREGLNGNLIIRIGWTWKIVFRHQ